MEKLEIGSVIVKILITAIVGLLLNKFLSLFRKRQLYLSCWNSLENSSSTGKSFTINASIYNKGKDKEKNVKIQVPNDLKCSAISSNYDFENQDGFIVIDRILPKQRISMIIAIEGERELTKENKPKIKSEDCNGKTYLTKDFVPTSAGVITGSIPLLLTGFIVATIMFDIHIPYEKIGNAYSSIRYDSYAKEGFYIQPIGNNFIFKNYDITKGITPVKFKELKINNEYLEYTFEVHNNSSSKITVSAEFDIRNKWSYIAEINKAYDLADDDEKNSKLQYIYNKYNVSSIGSRYTDKLTIEPNNTRYLTLSRKMNSNITAEDLNVTFFIKGAIDGKITESEVEFKFSESEKAKESFYN
ncbi:hypothetical protein [Proteus mirabilis]|uniref:hypothetical protein n=1 Tax=Proteus mirabilis TaxID=584 RepID=UPI000BC4DE68|nr:hypothetical protein [Proteus mirabilis]OZS69493.1 hypothetical protein CHI94_11415 [Proteus mirabilis]